MCFACYLMHDARLLESTSLVIVLDEASLCWLTLERELLHLRPSRKMASMKPAAALIERCGSIGVRLCALAKCWNGARVRFFLHQISTSVRA